MVAVHSIPPFPSDIDRITFGHWISGFVAGEGCFSLYHYKRHGGKQPIPTASFAIVLTASDISVLSLIASFFECGGLQDERKRCRPNWNQSCKYWVKKTESLATVIIPHFDAFPLYGRKKQSFLIWKKGIEVLWRVRQMPIKGRPGFGLGMQPKWTPALVEEFDDAYWKLRQFHS